MYTLYTDGGSRGNPGIAASAALLFLGESLVTFDASYLGVATNNVAEYRGLILGLTLASKSGVDQLQVCMDSELIVKQIKGEYKIKDSNMKQLNDKVQLLLAKFTRVSFLHVPRAQNKFADRMVNLVLDTAENI